MLAAVITFLIAIATFIFQEGLTNIIHGITFRMHSQIKVGYRIEAFVEDKSYTGIISRMTLRHVVMKDVQTNAEVVIPNSKIDSCVIKNSFNGSDCNKYIVEIPVSYADAEIKERSELVKSVIRDAVTDCAYTLDKEDINIYLNYRESSVNYSFYVKTETIDENFKACSWIKERVMQELAKSDIHIPYNVIDVNINSNQKKN